MLNNWRVTFEVVTQESAERRGFLDSNGSEVAALIGRPTPGVDLSFRQAIELFKAESPDCWLVEADCSPVDRPRWFTSYDQPGSSYGECRNISIHIPEQVTQASRLRLARYLDCYGIN